VRLDKGKGGAGIVGSRHLFRRGESALTVPAGSPVEGLRRWSVVDEHVPGAVHTGFAIVELDPGGMIPWHVHSYEDSLYVMEGEVVVDTGDGANLLRPGDYGVTPVGAPHALRNVSGAPARWASMWAPQPRSRVNNDTYAVPGLPEREPTPLDVRDPRTRWFGHIEPANMEIDKQTQDMLAVSASMRTALLVYSGITVKMMIDADLGAQLLTMFMVQYEPRGLAGRHDHPFEETYLILEGEVDAEFDGDRYRMGPGDVAWAGVGCVHAFTNPGPGIVRWLETQAPQPPSRHSYRFARDWEYLTDAISTREDADG
jgi:quercetin dioxygenase-like cupin family protein